MTEQTVADVEAVLREWLARNPYATLAALAGVGYVLGGGVPALVTRGLLGVGSRVAMERMLMRAVAPAARS